MLEAIYFDMIIAFIFYGILTIINYVGLKDEIPLLQIGMVGVMMFAIVPFLEALKPAALEYYGITTMLFVVANMSLFVVGIARYRRYNK